MRGRVRHGVNQQPDKWGRSYLQELMTDMPSLQTIPETTESSQFVAKSRRWASATKCYRAHMTPNTYMEVYRSGSGVGKQVADWSWPGSSAKNWQKGPHSLPQVLQSIAEVLHFLPQVLHNISKVSHSLPWSEGPRGVATCQNCPQREVSGPLVRVAQKRRPAFCGRWGITITPPHQSFAKIESHMTQFLDQDSCRQE